jgi:hypothetical protein
VLGSTEPRLWTPPLRNLSEPDASYGPQVVEFAREVLGEPLDPWQEWLVLHAGELLHDGRPRFRRVLVLVARQNGKTFLLRTLALYWLFVECQHLVVGTSTNLDYARESWDSAVQAVEGSEALSALVPRNGIRRANGEQCLTTSDRCRYKIAASNRQGGRSLTIDRLISDELREQHDWSAYNAAYNAMNARPSAQAWFISNQGDDRAVVLDSLRNGALTYLDKGEGDERLGLFEWSARDGISVVDPDGWAAANPNLGLRLDADTIRGTARLAEINGGAEEAGVRTEVLCQRVRKLNAAVDPVAWDRCLDVGTMDDLRGRLGLCLDVSPDGLHATLAVAALLEDDRTRVEIVRAWTGTDCADNLLQELPGLTTRIRPQAVAWFPTGPAAALAAGLRKSPPLAKLLKEIKADSASVCMGLAQQVMAGQVAHSGDALLDDHIRGAERLRTGDRWVFSRRGSGHVDAAYAAAGAVHLVRTMPAPIGKIRIVRPARRSPTA